MVPSACCQVDPSERLAEVTLQGEPYSVLVNKFPLFQRHMLLVSRRWRPQLLTTPDVAAVHALCAESGLFAYFNSWCAGASVNHLHLHIIDEPPPLCALPLDLETAGGTLQARGYPAHHVVFPLPAGIPQLALALDALIAANYPHNLVLSPTAGYLVPRSRDPELRGRFHVPHEIDIGGPEFCGVFTAYTEAAVAALTQECIETAYRETSVQLERQGCSGDRGLAPRSRL